MYIYIKRERESKVISVQTLSTQKCTYCHVECHIVCVTLHMIENYLVKLLYFTQQ